VSAHKQQKTGGGDRPAESPKGEELAAKAVDQPTEYDEIEEQIKDLSPEEAEMFVRALNLALKKRRWMLLGYIGALLAVVLGMALALYVYGTREPGSFVGWVFIIPPGLAALVLYLVGKYVRKLGT
jgi:hypothetical protein